MTEFWPFVPAGVTRPKLDFVWRGKLQHIGPPESDTPLLRRFQRTTSCGCFCLGAGIGAWGAARFEQHPDISSVKRLFDATFAYMADPDCLNVLPLLREQIPEHPKEISAPLQIRWYQIACILPGRWRRNAHTPWRELFHLANLVRHVLDESSRWCFEAWLDRTISEVDRLAPHPGLRSADWVEAATRDELAAYLKATWGEPLPPDTLRSNVLEDLTMLHRAYMNTVDWPANPYVSRLP